MGFSGKGSHVRRRRCVYHRRRLFLLPHFPHPNYSLDGMLISAIMSLSSWTASWGSLTGAPGPDGVSANPLAPSTFIAVAHPNFSIDAA